jgi:EmrB/QacA subfamily drug resistance transporter
LSATLLKRRSSLRLSYGNLEAPMDTENVNPNHAKRWLILGLLGIAQLMVVLDATIVNIALPSAQDSLGFSDDSRQWIVTAYALAFGSLLLLGGRLGDVLGRKRTFIGGLIGFAAASAIGGTAQSFDVLVAARAAQGVFGAILAPSALSLLTTTFTEPEERGKAFGVFGAVAVSGGALGLLLGGVLTEYLSWRWSMYVNILFAVPAAIGALTLLTNQVPAERPKIDIPGTLTATSGLFALVYGFSNAETHSWSDPVTVGMLAASAALLGIFVWLQARVEHPLLPLRVVADRTRAGSYLAVGVFGTAMFGVFLFLTYYMQQTLGYTPITTGLAFLPMMAAIMVTSTVSSTILLTRFGGRPLVITGLLLAASGMLVLTGIGLDSSYPTTILPALILMGFGGGMVFAPSMNNATAGVDPADAGVASAMVNTSQQVSGSIGTALLSTIAASAATSFASSHAAGPTLQAAAAVHSYTVVFYVAAGILAFGAIATGLLLRPGGQQREPQGEPALAH